LLVLEETFFLLFFIGLLISGGSRGVW
jgi:hypothetical protein